MVERPADVLPMDGKPIQQAWPLRLDAAMRRIPGLGIFIVIALMENWWDRGRFLMFGLFAVVTVAAIAREFLPPTE